jgi:hypothetical protein
MLPDESAASATDAARVRDYLFANGPALPQDVARACDVSIAFVLRLLRDGTLMELRPAETTTCEVCGTQNVLGSLCAACRQKLTPPAEDEEMPLPRRAPREEPVPASRRSAHRFHSRRVHT